MITALFAITNSIYPNVIQIRSEQEYNDLKKNNTSVIVQCFAKWCPACKKASPVFETLSNHDAC